MQQLQGKNIGLGLCGSIAAYKSVYLTRLLTEAGAEVWPILTRSAQRFVGAVTLSALAGRRAITDLWEQSAAGEIAHVELAHRIDLLVVAPCTADMLARLAVGRSDDILSTVALSTLAPKIVAPAMETHMWQNPATRANLETLRERGFVIIEPGSGELASGRLGTGRLAEPEQILETIAAVLSPHDLAGETVLVTAGPTREAFDPARFISNPATGRMGYAMAQVARRRGAAVTLVSGPTSLPAPVGVRLLRVETTQEMLEVCAAQLAESTIVVMAAAPADYRPASFSSSKLKKGAGGGGMSVQLETTPDILKTLKARSATRFVVGFAAETDNIVSNARAKLAAKDLDLIVANDLTRPDAGFAVETNAVTLLDRNGGVEEVETRSKEAIAELIFDRVAAMRGRGGVSLDLDFDETEPLP